MEKEMKLMDLAKLISEMKDDDLITFGTGTGEQVRYCGDVCEVKRIDALLYSDYPMYVVMNCHSIAGAHVYCINEEDERIGDFCENERSLINCCAKMTADFIEHYCADSSIPEIFTVY